MKHFTKGGREMIAWGLIAVGIALWVRAGYSGPDGWLNDEGVSLAALVGGSLFVGTA